MTVWLTSDTHFGDEGILAKAGRPFESVSRMDDALIQSWNAIVRPQDVVWHLGDFAHAPKGATKRYFRKLNGRKHLVVGNHDGDEARSCGWFSVHELTSLRICGVRLVLCHYPLLSWQGSKRNQDGDVHSIACHGHVHGTPADPRVPHLDPYRIDVGVDMRSMAPANVEELVADVRGAMTRVQE
ncbi:metallophosphoesterase family protein [Lichenibacterium dinghuense]|uniref:metallophosphoesterase family protein n=1 Tax=Lichenibacterium dinghuense TaxID=2895977 RepID=UPI001F3896E5|nr:metallophosphoesterase family protein [Lichenibacterium sp. 6Y81]